MDTHTSRHHSRVVHDRRTTDEHPDLVALLVLHLHFINIVHPLFAIGLLLFHEADIRFVEKQAFGVFSDQFLLVVAHHSTETVIGAGDLVIRIHFQ